MSTPSKKFTGKWIGQQRYCIERELGRGGMGEVYQAFDVEDPVNNVAIKVIHRTHKMTSGDLMRFQKEASLMSQLYHSNIIAFHELGIFQGEESKKFEGGYYIIMDLARGKSLNQSLTDDGRKDLAFLFQVGLQVADALDYTHGKNIIHSDIKPHNIIVSQAAGDERGVHIQVLDFGVARLGSIMGRDDGSNSEKAGTPLYMAPEQSVTGFGLSDHRVDLYSLGCVLYEILTGSPPFHGSSREEMERAHQTLLPESILNMRPDVPLIVVQIIHKLLEKRPDDRYQTAFSLSADLLKAKSAWELNPKSVAAFPLALKDEFFAVSAQLPLTGRANELEAILNEYRQVASPKGRARITVVTGAAGIGKTRVLDEYRSNLSSLRIQYVSGLFTQHENSLPFNALANAFNELLVKIIRINPVEADLLSKRIKQVIGPNAHLVANVVPGLKPFLSDIPEPDDGVEVDEENYPRFAKAFADFARSLVPETQPMVMILDDVHWADEKSLALITQIFSNANSHQYHLVVGCRQELDSVSAEFSKFIEKFRGLKLRFAEVTLMPLDFKAAQGVVTSQLRQSQPVGRELVEYLLARSGGVPMHLVELTRRMVAIDMITFNRKTKLWDWDISAIQGAVININAVDLVLGTLGQYKGADLAILRAAASNGMSFQYEILLLGGQHSPTNVIRLIDRAISGGVIVRHPEIEGLKHLGKAYVFVHKKVRDAIYNVIDPAERAAIHDSIAKQLIASIPLPQEQMLLALVQHINKSRQGTLGTHESEALCLRFNIAAGEAMQKKQGWTAAYNYYRIAYEVITKGKPSEFGPMVHQKVIENLADVNSARSNFKVALTQYAQWLTLPMSRNQYAAAASKGAQLQTVCGNISEAINLVSKGLAAVNSPQPDSKIGSQVIFCWRLLVDIVTMSWSSGPWSSGLNLCKINSNNNPGMEEVSFASAKLYRQLAILVARQSSGLLNSVLDRGQRAVLLGHASASVAIKIAADRAGQLASLGVTSAAYRLFDLADRLSRDFAFSRSSGYVSLLRATTIDYLKGRREDTALHLKEAFYKIDRDYDCLAYANMLVFKQYFDLTAAKIGGLESLNAKVRAAIPTRNHMSSISMALLMFSLLLQNRRERLVGIGEEYIRRRRSVGSREDLFSNIVLTMLLFGRGETDQTYVHFQKITKMISGLDDGEHFETWQLDFIGLFLLIFPMIFSADYRQSAANGELMSHWIIRFNESTKRRIWRDNGRSVQLLVEARSAELVGDSRYSRLYDQALTLAKSDNSTLVQILIYFWFGKRLLTSKIGRRTDYLKIAYKLAKENELDGLASHIQRESRNNEASSQSNSLKKDRARKNMSGHGLVDANVAFQHLEHIVRAFNSNSDFHDDLQVSLQYVENLIPSCKLGVYLASHIGGDMILASTLSKEDAVKVFRDASPYFTIRQTLFVHVANVEPGQIEQDVSGQNVILNLGDTVGPPELQDLGATAVLVPSNPEDAQLPVDGDIEASPVGGAHDQLKAGSVSLLVLVPIRVGGETIGIIVINNLGEHIQNELHRKKRDLDALAPQIGLLMSQKYSPVIKYLEGKGRTIPIGLSCAGGSHFEPAPNLEIKLHGKLRVERESSWYLGVDWGAGQYVVVYCCLKGEALMRDKLANLLLYQIFVMREAASIRGQVKTEVLDLRVAIQELLKKSTATAQMDEIMLSYSLFDQDSDYVSSGHYGSARPVVLGTENRLAAFNQTSLRLKDGRDLRYWEIFASLSSAQIFLVSYDTSRIDVEGHSFSTSNNRGTTVRESDSNPETLLDSALQRQVLPRYFLTVKKART